MASLVLIIVFATIVSFVVTPIVQRLATILGVVDQPDERKVHLKPVPMLGGVAIYAAMVAAVFIGRLQPYLKELVSVLLGATLVTVVGAWDDRYGMRPLIKLAGIMLATLLIIIVAGIQVQLFPFDWLNIAVTLLWVAGIANAINFLDNMDGLAAGLATVAAASFLLLAAVEELRLVGALAAATVGACVGFLYYNFRPARLFMGDAGSLLLGYVLAVLGMKLDFAGRPLGSTWMIPIVVLALPIFDTTLVVVSRLRGRRPVYLGGKDHISHRLVSRLGMSQTRAVVTLYYVAALFGMLALVIRELAPWQARLVGAGVTLAFIVGLIWFERGFDVGQANSSSLLSDDSKVHSSATPR